MCVCVCVCVCVCERDQVDLYLAYSVLGCYTHLCNTVEYCNKFSIPSYPINQFFFVNIYLFFIIIPSLGAEPP